MKSDLQLGKKIGDLMSDGKGAETYQIGTILRSWVVPGAIFTLFVFGGFHLSRICLNTEVPFVIAEGISMQPAIREGDIIIFRGVDPGDIRIGDIIIFKVPDELEGILPPTITHRVIDRKTVAGEVIFRTKGDNAPLDSFEVSEERVLGKKIAIIPYVGLIILLAKNPFGLAALVIGFIVISLSKVLIGEESTD